jgi:hypothetical protein
MQAAAPFMSAFVLYLSGLFGSTAAFRLAKKNFHRSRYLLAATFLIIALFFTFLFISQENRPAFAIENTTVQMIRQVSDEGFFPINATPQLVLSLLRSLVKEAGVPQYRITVFDASRFVTDNLYIKCHAEFPDVIFVDNIGGNGRTKATYSDNAIPFSVDNGALAKGIATCAVEADYLINMALLKGHSGQGVTLCGKNFYGATSIYSSPAKNAHNNFNPDATGKDRYMTFTDYLGHKDLGEKTMLFMIDGIHIYFILKRWSSSILPLYMCNMRPPFTASNCIVKVSVAPLKRLVSSISQFVTIALPLKVSPA